VSTTISCFPILSRLTGFIRRTRTKLWTSWGDHSFGSCSLVWRCFAARSATVGGGAPVKIRIPARPNVGGYGGFTRRATNSVVTVLAEAKQGTGFIADPSRLRKNEGTALRCCPGCAILLFFDEGESFDCIRCRCGSFSSPARYSLALVLARLHRQIS